jgi:sarcosine oxidase
MRRVAVIGGGVVGVACARQLAAHGCDVALFERYTIGNDLASSHGDVRMRVPAGFPYPDYVTRGQESHRQWLDLEHTSGCRILTDVGCLFWGEDMARLTGSLDVMNEPYEVLEPSDVVARWSIRVRTTCVWQPRAGYIDATAALDALVRSAVECGVRLHERAVVELTDESGDGVIRVDGAVRRFDVVVVAAGAWTKSLAARVGRKLAIHSTAQTVCYFDVGTGGLPGLIQYGAPDPYACPVPGVGLKAAFHAPGTPSDADEDRVVDLVAAAAVQRWIEELLGRTVDRVATKACRYTWTPDESFLIDGHGALIVVSACSGHGFQYAPDTATRVVERVAKF